LLKSGRHPLAFTIVQRGRVLSVKNKTKRLAFARRHQRDNWARTVFVDMKTMHMRWDEAGGHGKRWQPVGVKKKWKQASKSVQFNFYAAVAQGRKSELVMVDMDTIGKGGKLGFSSASFIKVMKKLWQQVKGWYSQGQRCRVIMDNARQHGSKKSKKALKAMGVPLCESFPAQSYDMNLIEVLWGQLQREMLGNRSTKEEAYEKALREAWGRVQQSTIDKLVANHNKQLGKIIKEKGNWVNY
jgi:transposase